MYIFRCYSFRITWICVPCQATSFWLFCHHSQFPLCSYNNVTVWCGVVSHELTRTKIKKKLIFNNIFKISFALVVACYRFFFAIAQYFRSLFICFVYDKLANLNTFRSMWIYLWNFKVDFMNRTEEENKKIKT